MKKDLPEDRRVIVCCVHEGCASQSVSAKLADDHYPVPRRAGPLRDTPSTADHFRDVRGLFLGGPSGGLIMTAGIFLPAFAFTLIGHNAMKKAIDSPRLHAFLEGVTAAVVGLMAVTTVKLLKAAIDDWPSLGIFVAALLAVYLWKSKPAIAFIVLGAGAAGLFMLR